MSHFYLLVRQGRRDLRCHSSRCRHHRSSSRWIQWSRAVRRRHRQHRHSSRNLRPPLQRQCVRTTRMAAGGCLWPRRHRNFRYRRPRPSCHHHSQCRESPRLVRQPSQSILALEWLQWWTLRASRARQQRSRFAHRGRLPVLRSSIARAVVT